ncbi:MAG TPA: dTDP-4-dehydrorhamnose 3,5-epimerase [Bacillota bacterium]
MAQIKVIPTPIPDLYVIEPTVFGDERGFFMESYHKRVYAAAGLTMDFVQDNHSKSKKGVLRGLHFQKQHPQGKLVRVVRGRVWDVAVDLRPGSPAFGRWFGVELSAANKKLFYIPAGFAHGFLTLEEETEFVYKCSDYYDPNDEGGIRYDDPQLKVDWHFQEFGITPGQVLLSAKDAKLPTLQEYLNQVRCG